MICTEREKNVNIATKHSISFFKHTIMITHMCYPTLQFLTMQYIFLIQSQIPVVIADLNRVLKVSVKATNFLLFFCHLWCFRHPAPLFCLSLTVQFYRCLQFCRRKQKSCFFTLGHFFPMKTPGGSFSLFCTSPHSPMAEFTAYLAVGFSPNCLENTF